MVEQLVASMTILAVPGWLRTVGVVLFLLICLLLIGIVLLQKGRGSGLSGAFGGVGGHSAFGARTGDFLTWVTVVLAGLFIVVAVALNFWMRPLTEQGGGAPQPLMTQPAEPGAGAATQPIDALPDE